ncbi:sensor domain-containing protein [Oceanobacillus sp. CAU 1775]
MYKNQILMDGISDLIFVVKVENESDFVYEFLNRAAMNSTGLTEGVIGKTIHEVYPENIASSLSEMYQKVFRSGEVHTYEDYYDSTEGRKYSETKLTPLFDDMNRCKQIVAIVRDRTDEKLAKQEKDRTLIELNKSNERYLSLFNYNPDAIISIDLNDCITHGNLALEKITGYKVEELTGTSLSSLFVEDDANIVEKLLKEALRESKEISHLKIENKSDKIVYVSLRVTPLIIDNEVIGIYGILRDITEITESTERLRESDERFRIIAENAKDLITLINDKGKIIYASPAYKETLGHDYREYLGKPFHYNLHPDDKSIINNEVLHSIEKGKSFHVQIRQFNNKKEPVWTEAYGTPVFDEQNKFKHIVVISRDISLQKEYEAKLEYFALHDSMTGLPNRRLFKERLEKEWKDYHESGEAFAILLLDIDNFKDINDTLGHDAGDAVIEEFGRRISKVTAGDNFAARLGGDEFVIILPKIGSHDNAISMAENIQNEIQKTWEVNGRSLEITTSMGVVISTVGIKSSTLLKTADLALYEAKNTGKNSFKLKRV